LHWFETLEEAKAIIEDWRRDYNEKSASLDSQQPGAS
jgi:transposase InsO family protein